MAYTFKPNKWNLSLLNIDEDNFDATASLKPFCDAYYAFINKWKNDSNYLHDPLVLKTALSELEELDSTYGAGGNAAYYFELRSAQDQENPKIKAALNKIQEIALQIENDSQFFILNLSKVSKDIQKMFLESTELNQYKHFLEVLFNQAKYLLTDAEEKMLNITSQSAYSNWVNMTSDLLSREEREVLNGAKVKETLNVSAITKLMSDKDKTVRDTAALAFNEILSKYTDIAEAEVNSIIQNKRAIDKARGHSRPDEARILSDAMSLETVDSLIEAVVSRNDISTRYYGFKAKLFGQEKLEYHERNLDYGDLTNEKYPYEKSVEIVKNIFNKLDPEFTSIFSSYMENGQIDVFPAKGKHFGAFCASGHLRQPGYVLLNHTDLLSDVTTIAHEMGHAINNELIRKTQPAFYFETPLATAEVASTFMEDFVIQEIEDNAPEELKLALLVKKLDEDISTIHRQVACYKFEQELHKEIGEQGYLDKNQIGQLFSKNMHAYMGSSINQTVGSENWWVYWSHIRSFFYVYSYASGLLISKGLQNLYKDNPKFIQDIKGFLSAGTSDSPENIFLKLGIDIKDKSFWLKGLDQVENTLNEAIELAKKLKKI